MNSATPTPQDLTDHALKTSRADHTIVVVHSSSSANLRWANNTLTTNGSMHAMEVTVISFDAKEAGLCAGSVSGTAASRAQVEVLVEAADTAARNAAPAQDAAELLGEESSAAPDWHLPPETTSIGVYSDFAPALGEAFDRAEAEERVLYGFVDHEVVTTYLGSTTGLRARHVQPSGHYGITGKDPALGASAWVGGATQDFIGVDPRQLDDQLRQRLSWSRRTVDLPAGPYETVLPPTAVADLLIYAYWSAGARQAHEGQSVYGNPGGGTRIGERIAADGVHLYSDPAHRQLACAPFVTATASSNSTSVFDNGLGLSRTDWIADGRLQALLQNRYSASLTGQPVTPGIDNLVLDVDGGTGGLTSVATSVERGLLVTCLWYVREVDPQTMLLTGLTRDGVYLIEGGEIVGAVNNFRFNESPIDLLSRFEGASTTVPSFSREWGEYFPRTATPALRIPDFNMSSVSQAQ